MQRCLTSRPACRMPPDEIAAAIEKSAQPVYVSSIQILGGVATEVRRSTQSDLVLRKSSRWVTIPLRDADGNFYAYDKSSIAITALGEFTASIAHEVKAAPRPPTRPRAGRLHAMAQLGLVARAFRGSLDHWCRGSVCCPSHRHPAVQSDASGDVGPGWRQSGRRVHRN